MIISKIYNSLTENQKEDVAWGLAWGLAGGLTWGLAWGLAWGLVTGVFSPLWLFIPAIIIFAEILFYFDRSRLSKKKNIFEFTLERKAEALFESLLIITNIIYVWVLLQKVDFYKILMENCQLISIILFYLGIILVGIIILASWVWLNSLKYKYWKKKKSKKRWSKCTTRLIGKK
jgi:MFS family permease